MREPRPTPLEKLTIAGRVLFAVTLLLFGGGSYFTVNLVFDRFPAGQYPVIALLMPVGIVCLFFFLVAGWLLERRGVQVYVHRPVK